MSSENHPIAAAALKLAKSGGIEAVQEWEQDRFHNALNNISHKKAGLRLNGLREFIDLVHFSLEPGHLLQKSPLTVVTELQAAIRRLSKSEMATGLRAVSAFAVGLGTMNDEIFQYLQSFLTGILQQADLSEAAAVAGLQALTLATVFMSEDSDQLVVLLRQLVQAVSTAADAAGLDATVDMIDSGDDEADALSSGAGPSGEWLLPGKSAARPAVRVAVLQALAFAGSFHPAGGRVLRPLAPGLVPILAATLLEAEEQQQLDLKSAAALGLVALVAGTPEANHLTGRFGPGLLEHLPPLVATLQALTHSRHQSQQQLASSYRAFADLLDALRMEEFEPEEVNLGSGQADMAPLPYLLSSSRARCREPYMQDIFPGQALDFQVRFNVAVRGLFGLGPVVDRLVVGLTEEEIDRMFMDKRTLQLVREDDARQRARDIATQRRTKHDLGEF
ncbi:hypothetical protein H696_04206 [Fonticula alba]|uniref:Interferon-related developmental regulator N-terminal domain-containing protein n=1 Tax=Fonticula alba TaxID=691883 RepID=A0A058Z5H6_FONAL|nr:hypothetical protein H696_04206 [Fonticula alba]KCV68787.1 hypothetical protein H696_04206 [Fonticula alba]|eukprot:XP_009496358.1 hypothetical protein H696_04206 [Fonticula alba]